MTARQDYLPERDDRLKRAHPEITRVFVEARGFEAHRRSLEPYVIPHETA